MLEGSPLADDVRVSSYAAGILILGCDNAPATFDIDGMDASVAPGTGTPEVGGLSYEQARRFLELVCTRNRLVGFDLVEVNPSFDPTQITALLSAQIMIEAMGFVFPRGRN